MTCECQACFCSKVINRLMASLARRVKECDQLKAEIEKMKKEGKWTVRI